MAVNLLLYLQGNDIRVQGGGIIHAIHVDIQPVNLIVDDLGEIIGDYHERSCSVGNGVAGSTGSGTVFLTAQARNVHYAIGITPVIGCNFAADA